MRPLTLRASCRSLGTAYKNIVELLSSKDSLHCMGLDEEWTHLW